MTLVPELDDFTMSDDAGIGEELAHDAEERFRKRTEEEVSHLMRDFRKEQEQARETALLRHF